MSVSRVLFLATYFPKPGNTTMGPWALMQAQSLRKAGLEVRVVSHTSWVPRIAARFGWAKAWASCPPSHHWDGLEVLYPRWPLYQVGTLKRQAFTNPEPQLQLAWRASRRNLENILRRFRPDVVFAHHTAVNGYLAERIHRLHGTPYVITDHDFEEITACESLPKRKALYEHILRACATNVCVARRMENDMRRIFPFANVRTVHNGIDVPAAEALLATPRPVELIGKKIIFSAGVMYERKGFPLLIEAFARVAGKHPDAVLRVAGDGPKRAEAEAVVRRHELGRRVTFLGMVPRDRVLQELAWSDFFALIGWDEPFATVFIEAMALGRPIIAASDGGINDVLESGKQGLTVTPKDIESAAHAMERLLSNPEEITRMGAAARQLVEKQLTWEANARSMIGLFEAAITQRKHV